MSDIGPVLAFLASHPALIKNLRTQHVPGQFGSCRGCPAGTAITDCQYLRWATEAERRQVRRAPR